MALPTVDAELVLDLKCGVGEGLFWDADDQLVRFVDIPGKKLLAYNPATNTVQQWDTPQQPGTFAKCVDKKDGFIVGFETGFYLYQPDTKKMTKLGGEADEIDKAKGGRLNDGRCDRQGRLVCGGFNDPNADDTWDKLQQVWQVIGSEVKPFPITPTGKVACANGTCFSPDGRVMYFCDTADDIIWAYDYDTATGAATNRRDFVDFKKQGIAGKPDGATVDALGGVWSSCVFDGKITRFQPDEGSKVGTATFVVNVPQTKYPTCPAFCGEDMDVLYITSLTTLPSAKDMEVGGPEEHAGGLFRVKVPFKGLPEPKFGASD